MDELTNSNEKLLQRMRYDMYFNLTVGNINRILCAVNMAKMKGKASSIKVNAGNVVFRFTYPNNESEIYDTVTFSYFNRANGLYVSSSTVIMEDLLVALKRVYAKAVKNI